MKAKPRSNKTIVCNDIIFINNSKVPKMETARENRRPFFMIFKSNLFKLKKISFNFFTYKPPSFIDKNKLYL